MFGPRPGPTLIGITQEDIDMATAQFLESTAAEDPTTTATAEAPLPVSPTNLDPVTPDPVSRDNNTADALSDTSSELLTQLPYEHLPYGREREEIVIQNHQLHHLEQMDQQFNVQRAISNAAMAGISTSHEEEVSALEEEVRNSRLAIQIQNWHIQVLTALAYPDEATDLQLQKYTDLQLQKYADLRQPAIRNLRDVGPAEASDEEAMKVEMNPPISTVLGIEGQGYLGGASAGRLYGAEEDLAVFSAGELGGSREGDARAGTANVGPGEGEGDGSAGGEERAAAQAADEETGEEETGEGEEEDEDEEDGVDARAAAVAADQERARRALYRSLRMVR